MKIEISSDKSSATIDGVEYTRKGKKISEWLNELPDGYRELALANFKEQKIKDVIRNSTYKAIHDLDWSKTNENFLFWEKVYDYYACIKQDLPPLPKPKFEVWKPKEGMECWYLSIIGEIKPCVIISNSVSYRYHQTKEQAIEAHEKAMFNYEVEMFIKEKNEGWLPDYKDEYQSKFRILYDYRNKEIEVTTSHTIKHVSDEKVFKSREIFKEIIAKFDNEKLVKWWI
jgi:hypothetical protein